MHTKRRFFGGMFGVAAIAIVPWVLSYLKTPDPKKDVLQDPASTPTEFAGVSSSQKRGPASVQTPFPSPKRTYWKSAAANGPSSAWDNPLRRFTGSEIISGYETDPDPNGVLTRVDILRTDFKYPLIKIRERWKIDPNTGDRSLQGRSAMVADHVLVTLKSEDSADQFGRLLAQNGWNVLRQMPASGIYLISIDGADPTALDQAIAVFKSHPELIDKISPDYIAFNNE